MNVTRNPNGQLMMNDSPVLTKYIRDKKNNKIGMVVALEIDKEIRYGFCATNTKKGDRFNKEKAVNICIGRAYNHPELQMPFEEYKINEQKVQIPKFIREYLERIYYRSRNYFKYLAQQPPSH